MRQATSRALFNYWNALRGARKVPDRAEIDLAEIPAPLGDLFMLELDSAHRFPFVMAGARLNALFCTEHRGRSFLTLWQPEHARNIAATLMTVIETSCPVLAAVGAYPEGYRDADIEILFLPLRHGGFSQPRILGIATPAIQPPWVGLLPAPHFILRALRPVTDAWELRLTPQTDAESTSVEQNAQPRAADVRGHLRVFDGGK